VRSVSFSPDGKHVASGSEDKTVKVWNVSTGECVTTLKGHSSYVISVSFSPDGTSIVSGSDDNTVKIWSTEPLLYDLDEDIAYAEFDIHRSVAIRLIYDDLDEKNTDISCDFTGGAKVFPVRLIPCNHIFCLDEVRDLKSRDIGICTICRSEITGVHVMTVEEIEETQMSGVNKDIGDLSKCKGYMKKLEDKREENARKEAERIRRNNLPRLKLRLRSCFIRRLDLI
jgi:hypothetical protein